MYNDSGQAYHEEPKEKSTFVDAVLNGIVSVGSFVVRLVPAVFLTVMHVLLPVAAAVVYGACATVVTAVITPFVLIASLRSGKNKAQSFAARFSSHFDGHYFRTLCAVVCEPFISLLVQLEAISRNFDLYFIKDEDLDGLSDDRIYTVRAAVWFLGFSPLLITFAASWLAFPFICVVFVFSVIDVIERIFGDVNVYVEGIPIFAAVVLTCMFPFAVAVAVMLLCVGHFVVPEVMWKEEKKEKEEVGESRIVNEGSKLVAQMIALSLTMALMVAFPPAGLVPLITTMATYLGIGHLAFSSLSLVFAGITATATLGVGVVRWVVGGRINFGFVEGDNYQKVVSTAEYRTVIVTSAVIFTAAVAALAVVCAPVTLVPLVATMTLTLGIESIGAYLGAIGIASAFAGIATFGASLAVCGVKDAVVAVKNHAQAGKLVDEDSSDDKNSNTDEFADSRENRKFNSPKSPASHVNKQRKGMWFSDVEGDDDKAVESDNESDNDVSVF